tara:strand:+ start:359 stop:949 length:591 start_codon:yes stop_codon:yes gene_type:complete
MGVLIVEGFLIPNIYEIQLKLELVNDENLTREVSFERMGFMLSSQMHNSIFVNDENPDLKKIFESHENNVILFPDDPTDHAVAIALYLKLNNIIEGNMLVREVKVKSYQGNEIQYVIEDESEIGPFDREDAWWLDAEPNTFDITDDVIMEYDWESLGMPWQEESEADEADAEPEKSNVTPFKVITGGKEKDADETD